MYVIVVYMRVRIVEFNQTNFKLNFKLQRDRWINRIALSDVAFTRLNTKQTNNQKVILFNQLLSVELTDSCSLLLIATG